MLQNDHHCTQAVASGRCDHRPGEGECKARPTNTVPQQAWLTCSYSRPLVKTKATSRETFQRRLPRLSEENETVASRGSLSLSAVETHSPTLVTLELTSNKISMTSAEFRSTFHFEFKVFCYKPTETVQFNMASLMLNEPILAVSTYIWAI